MIKLNLLTGQAVELEDNFTVGELLLSTRTAMGLRQYNFSVILGINDQSLISRYETSKIYLPNAGFFRLVLLYTYKSYLDIIYHFSTEQSFDAKLLYNPVSKIKTPVSEMVNILSYDWHLSYRQIALRLGINYLTVIRMKDGIMSAGTYIDVCNILVCFKKDSWFLYKMMREANYDCT